MARANRKASPPRVVGLPMNANVGTHFVDEMKPDGSMVKIHVSRRANNVFESLFRSHRINSEQRHAGNNLAEIYAKSKGAFNVNERSMERTQYDRSDAMTQMRVRASYGRQYEEIMGRLDQDQDVLLRALIKDFVTQDGARFVVRNPKGKELVRWRGIVQAVCQKRDKPCRKTYEGDVVARALESLVDAVIDYRKMQARNRRA